MPRLHNSGPIWQRKGREYRVSKSATRKPHVYIRTCPICDVAIAKELIEAGSTLVHCRDDFRSDYMQVVA